MFSSKPCSDRCKLQEVAEAETKRVPDNRSLYDRLGGLYAIAAVIDNFSNALITNPVVGQNSRNPFLRDWHGKQLARLPGLKFQRTLWVCALAGGPQKYIATQKGRCPMSLEGAHARFQISPEEFDAVAAELQKSLAKFSVPLREQEEVLAVFGKHKNEVNTGFFVAHHLPVPSVTC